MLRADGGTELLILNNPNNGTYRSHGLPHRLRHINIKFIFSNSEPYKPKWLRDTIEDMEEVAMVVAAATVSVVVIVVAVQAVKAVEEEAAWVDVLKNGHNGM